MVMVKQLNKASQLTVLFSVQVKADRGEAADAEELSQYEEPKLDEM